MNKEGLAVRMATEAGLTKTDAFKVINSLIDVACNELKKENGKIVLVGFGSFKAVIRRRKTGRNPRTGEKILIPKKKSVKFVAGNKLKELVQ